MLSVQRKIKQPDFLWMPLSVPYGFGALAITMLIMPYFTNPFWVFVMSVIVTTVIEFICHFIIEKLFHIQLWNYDHKRFNLQGRVALENSLMFGVLGLLLVYVIHPLLVEGLTRLPGVAVVTSAVVLAALLVIDTASATGTLAKIRRSRIAGSLVDVMGYLQGQIEVLMPIARPRKFVKRARSALLKIHRANVRRLHKAYPDARFRRRRAVK